MKKIYITGAGGFIGSHIVDLFLKKNFKVTALIKYNSKNNWGWLEGYNNKNLKIELGDITNFNFINNSIKGHDYIIHLAALIGIPYSYLAVENYYDVNVKGTINILNAARVNKLKKVLLTSTSEVYGSANYIPIDEKHELQAQSPYSASKIASDHIGEAFFKSFNVPVTIVRPFNAYGPRQSMRAVIPTIMSQILSKSKTINIGNISTARDYNYVTDIALAFYEILMARNTNGEIINVASGKKILIKDLIKKIINLSSQNKIKIKISKKRVRPKNSEVNLLLGCNKKIRKITKWKPSITFEEGLFKTYQWFKKNHNKDKLKSKIYTV